MKVILLDVGHQCLKNDPLHLPSYDGERIAFTSIILPGVSINDFQQNMFIQQTIYYKKAYYL